VNRTRTGLVGQGVRKRIVSAAFAAVLGLTGEGAPAWADPLASAPSGDPGAERDHTPPRLVYTHGQVSFWRPGAEDWGPAQVNTPLAPGDLLYAAPAGTVELQIGARAFARAGGGQAGAEIGLDRLERDYLQLKVASGTTSLDVRELAPGDKVGVDTPAAVLTIERAGYYRIEAGPERTAFSAYGGGPALLTARDGRQAAVRQDEQVAISGPENRMEFSSAPELSDWDRWSLARTDALLPGASARYVPSGVYGVGDLDQHGSWHVTPDYGSVWVPSGVAPDWAPYSTGRWISDPYYGWTWVDDAPWGWAPYHHGRWVHVGYWAWTPGPLVPVPQYAPALVTFVDPVDVTVSRPVSWVALGWGEPCVPWWGPRRFAGRPWWGGWGGPRIVHGHRNVHVHRAVVTVPAERFGRAAVGPTRLKNLEVAGLRSVQGAPGIPPASPSLAPATGHAVGPNLSGRRGVRVTQPPHDVTRQPRAEGLATASAPAGATPKAKLVAMPDRERRLSPAEPREPDRVRPPSDAREDLHRAVRRPGPSAARPPATVLERRGPEGEPGRPDERQRRVAPQPPGRAMHAPASRPAPPRTPSVSARSAPRVEPDGEPRGIKPRASAGQRNRPDERQRRGAP
jgi:hypothetical protein